MVKKIKEKNNNVRKYNAGNNPFLLPGATVATIFMLGALHARRMYSDKKVCFPTTLAHCFTQSFRYGKLANFISLFSFSYIFLD